ncbi:neuroglobin-like isoform X1 [Argiope bruennichi]|uniref:neuroglobin-like isoform X1 n=1 Tax=Argiope bruennichi TaxID=94029 RepID=UPI002494026A|nr:neuroglobin-like isoform X1 [Argiope bruennichi]
MGCQHTKSATDDCSGKCDGVIEESNQVMNSHVMEPIETVEVTQKQKELILGIWKELVDNISNVGVITFMNLFETHPDVQDVFMPFKGLSQEELRHSKELRAHGLRVMGFVQKVVARLDEPEKSEQLLKELGKNHVMYGAKIDYVDLIGPQFVYAVKPSLKEHWNDEVEEAWIQLFKYMASIMKKAMLETNNCQEKNSTKS